MAGPSLGIEFKTTSDVPQATEKAKSAVVSFAKQTEDIQKKFSTAFKDIFLSFLGPMALLGVAINYIGKLIEENQKKQADANQAAIDGTNELMSAEDRYYSRKKDREKKDKESAEQAKLTREEVTLNFLKSDPRGYQIYGEFMQGKIGKDMPMDSNRKYNAYLNKEVQDRVQAILAEDAKNNPLPADKKDLPNFKTPEGFSNVVGVGSNPVIEAMTEQLEIQKQQLAELQKISAKGADSQTDFTKDSK